MARIAGVNIPTQKRVEIALTYIFGIGRTTANEICKKTGLPPERRVHELTDDEVAQIREAVDQAVAEVGARGPGDMGAVMRNVMPRLRGRADGREVNAIVSEILRSIESQ